MHNKCNVGSQHGVEGNGQENLHLKNNKLFSKQPPPVLIYNRKNAGQFSLFT